MERNLIRQYFIIVLLLSLAIAITIRFPMVMNMIFGDASDHHEEGFAGGAARFTVELLITYVVALLMFTMNFFILKPVGKHDDLKVFNVALAIILTVVPVFILNHLLYSVSKIVDPQPGRRGHRNEFELTNFFVSALVAGQS